MARTSARRGRAFLRGIVAALLSVGTLALPAGPAGATDVATATLDPAFGSRGVVTLQDRRSPFTGALHRAADGSLITVVAAADDRLQVVKLRPDGSVDPAFGSAGRAPLPLHETSPAGGRRSSGMAVAADGRILVAGTSFGSPADHAFGSPALVEVSADGRTVGEPVRYVVSGVAVGGRGFDVAVSNHGAYLFALVGEQAPFQVGVQRFDASLRPVRERRFDDPQLDVLADAARTPSGRLLVASGGASGTRILAYEPDLARVNSFNGNGVRDLGPTTNRPSIGVDAEGRILVGRDPAGAVVVDRMRADGSTDASFNGGGSVRIPAPSGRTQSWVSVAAAADSSVTVANLVHGDRSQAVVTRLTADGSIDPHPAIPGGQALIDQPTFVERVAVTGAPAEGGVHVASTTDAGHPAIVRLRPGGPVDVTELTTSIVPASTSGDPSGRRLTDSSELAGAITASTATAGGAPTFQTAQYRLNPYRLNPYRLNQYRLNPYRLNPYRLNQYRLNPWQIDPFATNPVLSQLPVGEFELVSAPGWSERFLGSRWEGRPPLTVTWGEVLRAELAEGERDPLAGLTLADIRLERTVLADLPVAALALIGVPVAQLPAPAGGWCAYLGAQGHACPPLASTTLLDLELAGADTTGYLAAPLSLAPPTSFAGSPLDVASLLDVDLHATVLGDVTVASLPDPSAFVDLSRCPGTDACSTLLEAQLLGAQDREASGLRPDASVGALVRTVLAAGLLPDVTLAQVLPGFGPTGEVPLDDLPRDAILDRARLRSHDLHVIRTEFVLACAGGPAELEVRQDPGPRARYVPGTSRLVLDGEGRPLADPVDGSHVVADVCPLAEPTKVEVHASYEPGEVLGTTSATSTVSVDGDEPMESPPATLLVVDGPEPADDTTPTPIDPGVVVAGHISFAGDVDRFSFAVPSDLPVGSQVTATLAHLPADYDLAVAGGGPVGIVNGTDTSQYRLNQYRLNPYRLNPYRLNQYRLNPLGDDADEPGFDDSTAAPEVAGDVPLLTELSDAGRIRETSTNRGTARESVTTVIRSGDPGTTLTFGIAGYDAAASEQPYLLELTVRPGRELPECEEPVYRSIGAPGPTPQPIPLEPVAPHHQTLVLVAPSRMPELDLAKVQQYAAHSSVEGAIVAVDRDPDVWQAYTQWDESPCDVAARNAVVSEIFDIVAAAAANSAELRHVVVVGPDLVIPQAATTDGTSLGNETEHAFEALSDGGLLNPVSAALAGGFVLTDDAYGTLAAFEGIGGDDGVLPVLAVGRLVETAGEVHRALDDFMARDGVLAPSSAFTAGYDFLSDGAQAIDDALRPAVDRAELRLDDWDDDAAVAGINGAAGGYASVNGHYDQTHMLPASGDEDVLDTSDPRFADSLAGAVLFTSGCHAGLSIADQVSADDVNTRDWAQDAAARGALFVGNTGYGYGDTDTVAGSESLFAAAARNLASGEMTVGQAFLYAKQQYLGSLNPVSALDLKVSAQVSMFGLPNYRIGPDGGVAPSPLGGEDASGWSETTFHLTPTAIQRSGIDGTFFSTSAPGATDGVQATADRPLGWNLYRQLEPGPALKGVVLESLTTTDGAPTDPAVFTPVTDLGASTVDREPDDLVFPVQLVGRRGFLAPDGHVDQAILSGVQWHTTPELPKGTAIPRLVDAATVRVVRNDSEDFSPPVLQSTDAFVDAAASRAVLQATLSGGAVEGFALYRTDADDDGQPWHRADFVDLGGGRFGAAITDLPAGATQIREYILQFGDAAGNWAWSAGKRTGHLGVPFPDGGELPRLVADPPAGPGGVHATAPQVLLEGPAEGVTYLYRVDGGALQELSGAITVPDDEGTHTVSFVGDDGSSGFLVVVVDRSGPVITASFDPEPTGTHPSGPVTVVFSCADAGAGVATCPEPVVVESSRTVTVSASDRAGNDSTASFDIVIDDVAPTIEAVADPPANDAGWHNSQDGVTVSYLCDDSGGSGLASCPAPDHVTEEGVTVLERTALDGAGNTGSVTTTIRIDRTAPSGAVTSGDILLGAPVQGTAADDRSGVATVVVHFSSGSMTWPPVTADLECSSDGCTWSADPPGGALVRSYDVVAVITDLAGNSFSTETRTIRVL